MIEATQQDATRQAPLILVLPKRLVNAARAHAARTGWSRNAVVLKAMREYLPALGEEHD